eukprot:4975017-Prymnesium_polylepis.1
MTELTYLDTRFSYDEQLAGTWMLRSGLMTSPISVSALPWCCGSSLPGRPRCRRHTVHRPRPPKPRRRLPPPSPVHRVLPQVLAPRAALALAPGQMCRPMKVRSQCTIPAT